MQPVREYISMLYRLVRELGLKHRGVLDPTLIVSTFNNNQALTDKQVRPLLMKVLNKLIVWEFHSYRIVGMDIILWMDWFSKNHVIIDCNRKIVYSARD